MPLKTESHVILSTGLQRFAGALFVAAGVAPAMADEWAKSLVWANLRGVDSHGVLRIPGYIERLKTNAINPTPNMRVEKRAGAIALLEADRAPGAVAMAMAMAEAMACAREVHVGWCAARNITHAGAVGYFALQAANAGMAGIVMSASSGTDDGLPRRQGRRRLEQSARDRLPGQEPTAAVDRHVHVECRHGESDERTRCRARDSAGLGLDAQGRDTTDPRKLATLLPLGGAKGSGLSFMIECLCSLTVDNPIIAPALAAGGKLDAPFLNGVAIALDLAAFGDREHILGEADRLARLIAGLPPADRVERIYLPGERGDSILQARMREGIPLPQGTWSRLLACAKALAVAPP